MIGIAVGQTPAPEANTVHVALLADKASPETCRKWYAVYKGMYLYVHELDAQGTTDFDQLFAKLRLVRDKIQPAKGSANFALASQVLLDKYKEVAYKPETRTDFGEDILYIAEGIRLAIEDGEK